MCPLSFRQVLDGTDRHQVLGLGLGKGWSFLQGPSQSHLQEGDRSLPLGPSVYLQEKTRLPELPKIAVAVAAMQIMVRGPVFAAHVEDEWVTNAGKEAICAVRGCPVGARSPA